MDNLVCGLVRREDQAASCELLEFPICTTEEIFRKAIARDRLSGVCDEGVRRIRSVQPFHLPENSRMLHPLWLLHDLNNRDKHRAVHITIAATQRGEVVFMNDKSAAIYRVDLPPTTSLGPVTVPIPPGMPDPVRAMARGRFVVAFRSIDLLVDRPVQDVLATCIRYVDLNVFDLLKPLFRPKS